MRFWLPPSALALAALFLFACSSPPNPSEGDSATSPAAKEESPSTQEADQAENVEEPAVASLVGWWNKPTVFSLLELPDAEAEEITAYLRNLELSYQLAQTQLKEAREEQSKMLRDLTVPSELIEAQNQDQVQRLSISMLDQNIAARLWIRERLSKEQLEVVHERFPGFFRARWFRPARVAVRQGQVNRQAAPEPGDS